MHVLLTGGAGYIGSHICVELLEAGHDVSIVDNFSNSSPKSLENIFRIAGRYPLNYCIDLGDYESLKQVFLENRIDGVIHLAGLKAVGESVKFPLNYYSNNIGGTINLLALMVEYEVKNIILSSSATVYGIPKEVPIPESAPIGAINPYGHTKVLQEQILQDVASSDPEWSVIILRYFNPVGAHPSTLLGEDPQGIPNNLVPRILQVIMGKIATLSVFGNDYQTPDGTAIRDYIHVMDLALGHVLAMKKFNRPQPRASIYNLGTGCGYSVMEILNAFESIHGKPIAHAVCPRRLGDAPICYADISLAQKELGYISRFSLIEMCSDAYRWAIRAGG